MKFTALTAAHWPWVVEQINPLWVEDTKGIVALDASEQIVGALVFDNWTFTSCTAHICILNPIIIRRGFLEEGYRYVFEEAGREMLLGATPSDRIKALKLVRHLGWRELYTLKDGFAEGVDMIYTQFTKEDWINGKEVHAACA